SIEEEALAAVHNDKQGEVLAAELRALGRRTNRQPTPYSLAKQWARDKIANSEVKDATSGALIQGYSRAAAKAAQAAQDAMLKGDADETYRQKQAQMLNNALIAESGRVRDAVAAARGRLSGYAKRRTIKSMDQDYLEQIHGLLEQVEFKQRSRVDVERQTTFEAWAAEQEAAGHDVVVPASFASSLGTTNWTRLTVEKLLGLDDAVKQIAHLGRFKQKLLDGKEDRDYQEVVAEALSGIGNLPPRKPIEFDPSWSDRMKAKVEHIDAGLLKMETIVDWLDGDNSQGVFNRMAFRPIADAQTREQDMTGDYFGRIREAMSAVPKIERWQDRVLVSELIDPETGRPLTAQRQRLIAMALNMGNEGNIQRLTDGYGWNRDAVLAVLNRELTVDDWRFVQQTWDIIDTLWPEISAMERRVNGVEPDKVEALPIETVAGTLRGGYYPAVYDTARDLKAERNAGKATDLLEATYTRATTRASSTKERTDKVKRPLLLDVGVINRHLGEVIHDITHREALMNANKFLSDTRIQKAVNETLGPEIRKQFQPWLKHVANQWAADRAGNEGFGKFMGKLRANTTAVGMGFRASTVITQVSGFANSQEVVGGTWLAPAIAQAAAHPVDTYRFVTERSGEIRNRMSNLDRDIGAALRSLDTRPQMKAMAIPRDAARFMYHGIGYADRMVVIPTWIAAYNKALASGLEDGPAIYAADKAIRQSQGAGAAKDLAAIQTGAGRWGEAAKLMTMFYSYFSAVYQRQRKLGREVGAAGHADIPALLARGWWLVVVPPVLSALLVGKGPGEEEDWGLWSFKQMLFNSLAPIPVARDVAQPLWNKATNTPGFGASLSPVQRAYDTFIATGGDLGKVARGEDTKRATRDVLETAGYATGLVPGQIATATQFLVDVGYGEQDPKTVAEWYRGFTTGKTEQKKK
ncbi:MAG TPA: acetyltransferase, partial [Sphingomicrobium sp.]